MFKKLMFFAIFATTSLSFSQSETVTEVSDSEMTEGDVPFAVIEKVPIYPSCEDNTNVELKKCMSTKISEFIGANFDMKKIEALDLPPNVYRVAVQFKIDKEGNVVNVRARATHPEIENEAIRVVSDLPQMIPGKQKGEPVGVLYSLPIVFKVEAPTKPKKKKRKRKRNS
jgi:protein TonB